MPYIQKKTELNNNNINNMQNPGIKPECKDEEKNKKIPAILVPASLFYNPIVKNHKNIYTVKHNEENEINNKLKIQNKKTNKYKKNYSNQINDKNYNQNQNLKHLDYNMNDKSVEE